MNIHRPPPARAGSVDFVDGETRLYGIVGDPVRQARSPQTVTYELRKRSVNAILVPLHIAPKAFDEVFPQLLRLGNLDGLVVTVPHKPAALRNLGLIGPLAVFSDSVSVIARSRDERWVGEMFDGAGCVAAILKRGVQLTGMRVLLLGAGGAGAAIAAAVASETPASLAIRDPDEPRRRALQEKLAGAFPALRLIDAEPSLDEIDVLINASPVGMLEPDRMPIDVGAIPGHVAVMDAIMDPDQTRLLKLAEACGCRTIRGREMLDAQIVEACDFMLGARSLDADDIRIHHARATIRRFE